RGACLQVADWRAAERSEDAVDLPILAERTGHAAISAVAAPRELVYETELQVVAAVESRRSPVAPELTRRVPQKNGAAVAVVVGRIVHRLAQGVRALDQQSVRERLVQRHLQRVVLRVQALAPGIDGNDASERGERAARRSAAE